MNANDRYFEAELDAVDTDRRERVSVSKEATVTLASAMTTREVARRT